MTFFIICINVINKLCFLLSFSFFFLRENHFLCLKDSIRTFLVIISNKNIQPKENMPDVLFAGSLIHVNPDSVNSSSDDYSIPAASLPVLSAHYGSK